jgi:hypothetical protein
MVTASSTYNHWNYSILLINFRFCLSSLSIYNANKYGCYGIPAVEVVYAEVRVAQLGN